MSTTPLNPIIEMYINGAWRDITPDIRLDNADSGGGVEVTRGVPNEGAAAEPTQLNLTLNNGLSKAAATAGQSSVYSPNNPVGPWFGKLGRNQRVRYGLDRRIDSFTRTVDACWGYMANQAHADGSTVIPGERWHSYGSVSWSAVTGTEATLQGSSGTKILSFMKTYSDVEVSAKMKVSARDSEFGLVLRMKKYLLDNPISIADPQFDTSVAGWISSSGTVALDTVIKHSGAGSAKVTVTGAPASASLTPGVLSSTTLWAGATPGRTYTLRCWARSSIAGTIRHNVSWYAADATTFVGSTFSDIVVAANTWTLCEGNFVSPTDAAYGRPGPILIGSPPTGTNFWIDDLELMDVSQAAWYSVYVTPGGTDQIRVGKVGPGIARSQNVNLATNIVINTYYYMKAQISGQRIRGKIWLATDPEPKAWQNTWFDELTVIEAVVPLSGEVGVISKNGTALMTLDDLQVDQWRAHAEIAELPPRWDISRSDRWIPIQARGILRRLGQGRKALKSALSLHLESYLALSYGWWQLESDTGDTASNSVERGPAGVIRGLSFSVPDQTGNAALPGASGFATLDTDTSSLTFQIKPHTASGKETMLFFIRVPAVPASEQIVATFKSTGSARTWQINLTAAGAFRVLAKDKEGLTLADQTTGGWGITDLPVGCWIGLTLYLLQSGGNVVWALNYHRPGSTSFWTNNSSFAGTVGRYNEGSFKSNSVWTAAGNLMITQIMHYAGDLPFVTDAFHQAAFAYASELATTRFLRLGANANINVSTMGSTSTSTAMGNQTPSKLVELMEESAEVEDGFMVEDRDDFALSLITRASTWNRRYRDLDIDAGHLTTPLDPNTDDQGTRNDITATRNNGGSARSIQLTGPLNINPPEDDEDGVGTYDEGPNFNVYTDSQVQSIADWRRSKGTQDEPRYPAIHADLTAVAYQRDVTLVAQTMGLDIGDVIRLDNPEADFLLREELISSYTETADLYDWDIEFNANPSGVRRVGVVGYTTRVGSESNVTSGSFVAGTGTKLGVSLTGTGSSFVDILTSEASYPLDIVVSGVQLRVTAKGDVLNTDPGFELGISQWSASSANAVLAWERQEFKRGSYSLRASSLAAGTDGAVISAANAVPAIAAASYLVSGWVKTEIGATDVRIAVDWYQSNNTTFISTGLPTLATTVANTWTWFTAVLVAPALTGWARLRLRNVYAGATKAWYDEVRIMPITSYNTDPYTLTVEQVPINGIIKTIASGSKIVLADPWHVGW